MTSVLEPTDRETDFDGLLTAALDGITPEEVRRWEDERHLPPAVLRRLAEHGVFRRRWAEGAEGGLPHLVTMARRCTEVCSGLAIAAMGHSEVFTGGLHWLADGPEQRQLLDDALAGRALGCFASTEPHGGSNLAGVRSEAVPTDDGGWRLRGHKRYISNLGGTTHGLVLARLAGRGERNLALFVLPWRAGGVRVHGFFEATGLRSCDVGEASFDVELPRHALLGTEGLGLAYANRLLQFERLSICAQLLAGARQALRLATAYARKRVVFGEPILAKQATRHRLAQLSARLWIAEGALRDLVASASAGEGFAHQVAALKLVTSDLAEELTGECLQVMGARGYTSNFPLERMWRDARLARVGGGAHEVLTEVVASRLRAPDPQAEALLATYEAGDEARL